jgi:hypothetical protein
MSDNDWDLARRLTGLWRRPIAFLREHGLDRRTRIAIAMGLLASLGAVTAYRASEEELKGANCERRLGEAQIYELVQRQTYLDRFAQHQRWSDRYAMSTAYAQQLLRQADAIRENGRHGNDASPELLDVEAQIELASARTITPVRDFTDPGLVPGPTLERGLRMKAQRDVRDLGLPDRCGPRDVLPASNTTESAANSSTVDYLQPLREQVEAIHAKGLQNSRSVVGFVLVLLLFTLSEVFQGRARAVLESTAIILFPTAVWFAVTKNDDRLLFLFFSTTIAFAGVLLIVWTVALVLGFPKGRSRTTEGQLWKDYRAVRVVSFGVRVILIALMVSVLSAVNRSSGYQTPLLGGVALILAGLGWIARLSYVLEAAAAAARSDNNEIRINPLWYVASVIALAAFAIALPVAAFTLPHGEISGFLSFTILLGVSLGVVQYAMRDWMEPLDFIRAEYVSIDKIVRRLARTHLYVVSLGLASLVFLVANILTLGRGGQQYQPFAVCALVLMFVITVLMNENMMYCKSSAEESWGRDEKDVVHNFGAAYFIGPLLYGLWGALIALVFSEAFALLYTETWVYEVGVYLANYIAALFISMLFLFWLIVERWSVRYDCQAVIEADADRGRGPGSFGAEHDTLEAVEPTISLPDPSPAREMLLHRIQSGFDAAIVIAIVSTALLSAFAGFRYGSEHIVASDAADRAAEAQLRLLRGTTRETARAYHAVDVMTAYQDARLRQVASLELSRAARTGLIAPDVFEVWDHEARRWSANINLLTEMAREQSRVPSVFTPSIAIDDAGSPYQDPAFPERLMSHAIIELSARELALWDAYDESGTTAEQRATTLLGAIALFGIALYLFGQALQMGRLSAGGYFLALCGCLVVFGGILLGFDATHPLRSIDALVMLPDECNTAEESVVTTRADAASICYARAEVLARLARGQDDFNQAHNAYIAATRPSLRPEFALALYRAVDTTSKMATPQTDAQFVSIVSPDRIGLLLDEDGKVMRELDRRDRVLPAALIDSYAFHRYLAALRNPEAGPSEIEYTLNILKRSTLKRSTAGDASDASLQFHRGLIALAAGRTKDSTDDYNEILDEKIDPRAAIAAISDLNILRANCPPFWKAQKLCDKELVKVVKQKEAQIAAKVWFSGVLSESATGMTQPHRYFRASVAPGGVAWRLTGPAVSSLTQPVAVLVSRYDPDWKAWYLIPDASGLLRPGEFEVKGSAAVGLRSVIVGVNHPGCLAMNGEYRIALYSGAHLIGQEDVRPAPSSVAYDAVLLREQGMAFCYPGGVEGWQGESPSTDSLSIGYSSPDGSRGVRLFVFFFARPTTAKQKITIEENAISRAIDITSYRLRGHSVSQTLFQKDVPNCGSMIDPSDRSTSFTFRRLTMLARAWTTPDGAAHVGVVWAEQGNGGSKSPDGITCAIFGSMASLERNPGRLEQ